jgi:hypothetical protein
MSTKAKSAVGKARKTPTVKDLTREIRSDRARETTLKHEAATAKTSASRKHDLAEAHSLGHKITSLKHERAAKEKSSKSRTGLALAPGDVSCCAAQALAASLRLALGAAVHEEDVLALYWRTAGDPDEGATVLDTLRAAREYGLSGVRPVFAEHVGQRAEAWRVAPEDHAHRGVLGGLADDLPVLPQGVGVGQDLLGRQAAQFNALPDFVSDALTVHGHSLILRLDLPAGPHAVTVAPDGTWWSWGEPYTPEDFAGAVIDQAWAVTW